MNVVGDIAGNYLTLRALLKQMPDELPCSVGDMVDRGPRSKEVLEFFKEHGVAVMGNHEHMMCDRLLNTRFYDSFVWGINGGKATLASFDGEVPREMLSWVNNLPRAIVWGDGTLITHAPIPYRVHDCEDIEDICSLGRHFFDFGENTILWNRDDPIRSPHYDLQINGHNAHWGYREVADEKGVFSICLDTCRQGKLTGIHLPSLVVYEQEFID